MTSITTGIVTVSLMDKASPSVTRTINQIVERTVQTVLPASPGATNTVKTVVVKNDDLAAQSILKVQKSIIRIVSRGGGELVARGILTDAKGTAVTDRGALDYSGAEAFDALLPSGARVPLTIRNPRATSTLVTLDVDLGTSTNLVSATLANAGTLQLGQSVIRMGGMGTDSVGEGVVASLPPSDPGELPRIEASVSSSVPGAVILTIFGEIVGMTTTESLSHGTDSYTDLSGITPAVPATKVAPKT